MANSNEEPTVRDWRGALSWVLFGITLLGFLIWQADLHKPDHQSRFASTVIDTLERDAAQRIAAGLHGQAKSAGELPQFADYTCKTPATGTAPTIANHYFKQWCDIQSLRKSVVTNTAEQNGFVAEIFKPGGDKRWLALIAQGLGWIAIAIGVLKLLSKDLMDVVEKLKDLLGATGGAAVAATTSIAFIGISSATAVYVTDPARDYLVNHQGKLDGELRLSGGDNLASAISSLQASNVSLAANLQKIGMNPISVDLGELPRKLLEHEQKIFAMALELNGKSSTELQKVLVACQAAQNTSAFATLTSKLDTLDHKVALRGEMLERHGGEASLEKRLKSHVDSRVNSLAATQHVVQRWTAMTGGVKAQPPLIDGTEMQFLAEAAKRLDGLDEFRQARGIFGRIHDRYWNEPMYEQCMRDDFWSKRECKETLAGASDSSQSGGAAVK